MMRSLLVALILLSFSLVACGDRSGLARIDMQRKVAPDFSLVDQRGHEVKLGDLRGKVVALTFLYTSCPDVCPVVTGLFGEAFDKLGDARRKAAFVAVSVDPERDTPERVGQYLEAQRLQDKVLFLTGSRAELEAVWAAYLVSVIKEKPQPGPDGNEGFYYVTHNNLVHLIDAEGRQRSLIKNFNFTAAQLTNEMKPLLNEAK
jgi:protein SCO1/2